MSKGVLEKNDWVKLKGKVCIVTGVDNEGWVFVKLKDGKRYAIMPNEVKFLERLD